MITELEDSSYLGDGVYAKIEHGRLALLVSNGLEVTDRVYLEDTVLANLFSFLTSKGVQVP
jgi:hypothetical protein